MKVKKVTVNNRKKAFEIVVFRGASHGAPPGMYEFPFSKLVLRPSESDPIQSVEPDAEIGFEGFTYRLASGNQDVLIFSGN